MRPTGRARHTGSVAFPPGRTEPPASSRPASFHFRRLRPITLEAPFSRAESRPTLIDMQANVQRRQARRHWEAGRRADEKGRWSDAEREYRAAVRLAPHESLYWLGLAISLLEQDAPVQAEDAATRALNLKPDNLLAARLLARCLTTQNRHHEAADVYLRLPESVSRTAQVLMEQGELLLRAERWQEAISTYLECLRQDVRNSIAYQHMGLAFQHINHPR